MYTVKEVADLLDVSQVTIYNHLKKNDKELRGQVTKKKGVTYIKDEGLKVLKVSLGIIQVPTVKENISLENIIDEISLNIINDIKDDFIEVKGRMIQDNHDLMARLEALEKQNNTLIQLLQDKPKSSLIDKFKGLFK